MSAADTPETRRKEAERYLQVSPPKALFEDMGDKMAETLPADQREQFKKLMTTEVDIAALSKAMTDAMVKNFTTEELKALADFYGSPVGKSAMKKFGAYMADIMPVVQAEIMKAAAKMTLTSRTRRAKPIAAIRETNYSCSESYSGSKRVPGRYQELLEFLKWDGEVCRDREPGTARFDVYCDPKDDNAFFVYQAYRYQDAFEAHKKNEPFQRSSSGLRDTLGTNYTVLLRGDAVWPPAVDVVRA